MHSYLSPWDSSMESDTPTALDRSELTGDRGFLMLNHIYSERGLHTSRATPYYLLIMADEPRGMASSASLGFYLFAASHAGGDIL